MSTYFEYSPFVLHELASSLEHDIALALRPKPELTRYEYWVIDKKETPYSFERLGIDGSYKSAKEAIDELSRMSQVEPASIELIKRFFPKESIVYQDKVLKMTGQPIPILYAIHHSVYTSFPSEEDVLDISDHGIHLLKYSGRRASGRSPKKAIPET